MRGRAFRGSPLDRGTLDGALAGCDALAAVSFDEALNAVVALAARRELRVPLAIAVIGDPVPRGPRRWPASTPNPALAATERA